MSLNWMIKRLVERVPSGVLLLVLDACRDNVADSTFKGGAGGGAGAASGGLSAPVIGASSVRRDRCRPHCPRLRDHCPYFTQPVLLLHLIECSARSALFQSPPPPSSFLTSCTLLTPATILWRTLVWA